MKRKAILAVLIAALAALAAGWYYWGPVAAPAGQPALAEINEQTLEKLRADFNAAADQPRIVALLSPT